MSSPGCAESPTGSMRSSAAPTAWPAGALEAGPRAAAGNRVTATWLGVGVGVANPYPSSDPNLVEARLGLGLGLGLGLELGLGLGLPGP